jgi:hypothetical protein
MTGGCKVAMTRLEKTERRFHSVLIEQRFASIGPGDQPLILVWGTCFHQLVASDTVFNLLQIRDIGYRFRKWGQY